MADSTDWGQYRPLTPETTAMVLRRIADQCEKDPDDAQVYCEEVTRMLDGLMTEDFFGSEGQCDPRGDHRN